MIAGDKNNQQIGQNPINQSSVVQEKKVNYWMVSTIVLTIVLLGFSFIFINKNKQMQKQISKLQTENITSANVSDTKKGDKLENWKIYSDPTSTYSIKFPENFKDKLYPWANTEYLALTYEERSGSTDIKETKFDTGRIKSIIISIYLMHEPNKSTRETANEALSDEYKVPAFNDEVSKLNQIILYSKDAFQYTTRNGNEFYEEIYIDLGKQTILHISTQYRGENDFIEQNRALVKEILSSLVIN